MLYRGTTPTYIFSPKDENLDMTQAIKVCVTFSNLNGQEIFTKTGTDLSVSAHSVSVYLTQEETLSLPKRVCAQLNWLYEEGSLTKRACSQVLGINTEKNLIDEVLT